MRVRVKGPYSLEYKGKLYLPGNRVDINKEDAQRLLVRGIVIEEDAVSGPEETKSKPETQGSERKKTKETLRPVD